MQPPPFELAKDPAYRLTTAHPQTLSVWMPRDATFAHFRAFLENEYPRGRADNRGASPEDS